MPLSKKLAAEFFGTFWLVFGGCGAAVLDAAFPQLGIGFAGVALAFGLTVLTMVYTIGHISGCHLNPAVSVGLAFGKRFPLSELIPYIVAQVVGALAASGVLYVIASGKEGFSLSGGFASNGYGAALAGRLLAGGVFCGGSGADVLLFADDSRGDGYAGARRICGNCDWIGVDADSFGRHPGDEHCR